MHWFEAAQAHLRRHHIDGWLLYDFRGSNSVFHRLLGGKRRHVTRRAYLFVPAAGQPALLHHHIDTPAYADVPLARQTYLTWQEMRAWIAQQADGRRLAMEYAPGCALPVISMVDAGTVELVRASGAEVVSSADLIQACVARWSAAAQAAHATASAKVAAIKDAAFALMRTRIAAGNPTHEWEATEFIRGEFRAAGLEFPDGPIVAVNQHSGDPHFEPSPHNPAPIRKGDWVLLDLWARIPGDENIYSDITWMAYAGQTPPPVQQRAFETVRAARDAALRCAVDGWRSSAALQGWQLDDAARNVLLAAGYADAIRHRTGHSLSPGPAVHGVGVNLDNLETHDTRLLLPGIGFTIEPGVYGPEFGVRMEINVFIDPQQGPTVTSAVQDELVRLA